MGLFKKEKPVMLSISDDDGIDHRMEMRPDTPEFAAAVKQMVDKALAEVKKEIGVENWDKYCTTMFTCSYDKGQGLAQCVDGNVDQLLLLMAVTIHTMVDAEVAKDKFAKKPKGGNAITALIIQKLVGYVNSLDHDGEPEKKSNLIVP